MSVSTRANTGPRISSGSIPRMNRSSHPRVTQITFGSVSDTKWQEEQRSFLHQRLRLFGPLLCLAALVLNIRFFVIFGMWQRLRAIYGAGMLAGVLLVILFTALLYADKNPTLARLRRFEILLLLAFAMISVFLCLGWHVSGVVVTHPAPAESQELLRHALWVLTPENISQFRVGPTLISFPTINNWSILCMLYGVMVPNTWRRGALVQGLLVLSAPLTLLLSGLGNPALRPVLLPNVTSTLFLVSTVAVISLYASIKFNALRRTAFDAQQVGQYRLHKQLGKGAMGEVYLAQHRLLRRPCAIKLIRPEQAGSREYLLRFEREVQAMARLTHPNTVEIYDYGHTEDGTFFYAMEYLPGMTLDAMVRTHGPLCPGRVVHLLRQVLGALSEAHRQGIIHRGALP